MDLNNYLGRANRYMCDDKYVTESEVVKEDFDAADIISKATDGLSKITKAGGENFEGLSELKAKIEKVKSAGDKVTQDELKALNDLYISLTVKVKDKTGDADLKQSGKQVDEAVDEFANWRKAFAEFNNAAKKLSMLWLDVEPTDAHFTKEYGNLFKQSFDEFAYELDDLNDAAQKVKS